MPSFKSIIEDNNSRSGRVFDLGIQFLIVVSLVSFSLETLPNLSAEWRALLSHMEIFCVAIFTFEYLARIWVADSKPRFIFSFFGIVDLLAILPFYLATSMDLRSLRAFRLLRLIRILKLARYSAAAQRFHRAFLLAREELILFMITALIILYLTGVGIYYFENAAQPQAFKSVFHSLWWSVATLTAVGYGDVYPITAGGKFFTSIILLIGLGIVSVPAAIMASALSKAKEIQKEEDAQANAGQQTD
ncbi:MAG: ion transporter [Gammaproteobacteria bacterium]|nr:ion transporter [Gammaproteobacteria bacterium]